MADVPLAVIASTRPPLPRRPIPHEKTPDRPAPAGGRPHPRNTAYTDQHDDTAARQLLDVLYRQYAPMVVRTAARALRFEDRDLADDIAQQAWLDAWVLLLLLRGEGLRSPAGFLAMRARRCAVDHYRLARVQREEATDYTTYTDDDLAVDRLARLIGAAA
ncbi:RNA polymerase sigma factor [Streptomyces sp. DSM 40484]|uniref:RNA polymerase sigma factor n=1 Tax=Streptomyces kroppenstedtii TaxID=3051181 RepID=UPI0028D70B79|nr:sigma factor [Streptomyces sp. DSM 40484]